MTTDVKGNVSPHYARNCSLRAIEGDRKRYKMSSPSGDITMWCPSGTVFSQTECTCVTEIAGVVDATATTQRRECDVHIDMGSSLNVGGDVVCQIDTFLSDGLRFVDKAAF